MCSELTTTVHGRRSRTLLNAALLVALTGALLACGNKKAPTPPPSKVPAPVRDLTIQQRGNDFILRMTYPSVTMGGQALEEIESIEVWELVRIVPTFLAPVDEIVAEEEAVEGDVPVEGDMAVEGEPAPDQAPLEEPEQQPVALLFQVPAEVLEETELPEQAKEALIRVDPREYSKLATSRRILAGEDLDAATDGDQVTVHVPIAVAEGEEEQGSVIAVTVKAPGRRPSSFSNLVTLVPREAPSAPDSIEVAPSAAGVMVTWEGNEELAGYKVYRRSPKSKEYGEPLASLPASIQSYMDSTASFGSRYIYTVTGVSSLQPLVESAITAEHQVNYRDRFPPLAPRNLVAFPEPGQVRLLWDPPTAEDVAGYLVYRQEQGGEFMLLETDPVTKAEYLDTRVTSGGLYRYMIRAVDGAGNESETSEEIEVRIP